MKAKKRLLLILRFICNATDTANTTNFIFTIHINKKTAGFPVVFS